MIRVLAEVKIYRWFWFYNICAVFFSYTSWIWNSNQIAQIVGKPDLAPAAWVRRLVTLCDRAPATPFDEIRLVLERELGRSVGEVFERFDVDPLGSASIAQVPLSM
jgi:hypothetical protein